MASDDVILSAHELKFFFGKKLTLRVEEKVDGGNLGISLSPSEKIENSSRPAFRFQKRAHYISSSSEPQYRGLDVWASRHARALRSLLRMPLSDLVRDTSDRPAQLGQRIVFGEWLAAQHSKSYVFLPDVFLVFDIFDRTFNGGRGGFVSANVRDEMLRRVRGMDGIDKLTGQHSRIYRVRTCMIGAFSSPKELKDMLYESRHGLSVYTNDPRKKKRLVRCEGFYLRLDNNSTGLLRARCKLVHGSFHQSVSEGRWERRSASNTVRKDLWIGLNDDGVECVE
jgi:hypothetical protein